MNIDSPTTGVVILEKQAMLPRLTNFVNFSPQNFTFQTYFRLERYLRVRCELRVLHYVGDRNRNIISPVKLHMMNPQEKVVYKIVDAKVHKKIPNHALTNAF